MTTTHEVMRLVDAYIKCENPPTRTEICAAVDSLVADAEQWRKYKFRKDEVIAAGMGRNPLRSSTEIPNRMIDASNEPTDSQRLDWALPILTGHDSENADALAMNLAMQLMRGLDGRAAIDAAMEAT